MIKNRKKKPHNGMVNAPKLPVLKKSCCYINNQNFKISDSRISFPVMVEEKSKRISVKVNMTDRQKERFSNTKLGTMRIVGKGHTLAAQIVYEVTELDIRKEGKVMGVDLGIKCPAFSYAFDGKIKFYGNGKRNKYIKRHYQYLRKKLQKSKKMKAVKKRNNEYLTQTKKGRIFLNEYY